MWRMAAGRLFPKRSKAQNAKWLERDRHKGGVRSGSGRD